MLFTLMTFVLTRHDPSSHDDIGSIRKRFDVNTAFYTFVSASILFVRLYFDAWFRLLLCFDAWFSLFLFVYLDVDSIHRKHGDDDFRAVRKVSLHDLNTSRALALALCVFRVPLGRLHVPFTQAASSMCVVCLDMCCM